MNLEDPLALSAYLKQKGVTGASQQMTVEVLSGGVSCHTLLVRFGGTGGLVIKQALPKLKVKEEWYADPRRIHIEAAAMKALEGLIPAGSVARFVFEDPRYHILAMEAVPTPHENWKQLLLQGTVDPGHFEQFAHILAGIHRGSFEQERYRRAFADRSFFESLRLQPYYAFTAEQVPPAAGFLQQLIADTLNLRCSLVHGDYSPKNVLIHRDRLVLLDHEVMHYGDGAFDIGFSMTHFLSKALHLPAKKESFTKAARHYWKTYVDHFEEAKQWESRAVRHTIACMLARVHGKSPLEYLDEGERRDQSNCCLRLLAALPESMNELISAI